MVLSFVFKILGGKKYALEVITVICKGNDICMEPDVILMKKLF